MTNIKHIEHPEDTILTGDLDILNDVSLLMEAHLDS